MYIFHIEYCNVKIYLFKLFIYYIMFFKMTNLFECLKCLIISFKE